MNKVKHLAVIFLIFVMCFSMVTPVYAANTLELLTQKLNAYDGNICTVKYWSPDNNYNNVLIIGTKSVSYGSIDRWNLIYYKDGTTFTYLGNNKAWSASESFYYKQFTTYEAAVEALFNNESATDYATLQQFANFTYGAVYLYQDEAYSDEAAASMEAAYYDWYVETYGKEPEFEKIDTGDGESTDNSGIISKLEEFIETFKQSLNPDVSFLDSVQLTILENLEENSMYNSLLYITNTLQSLFTEDYTKYSSYKANTVLKINSDTTYKPTPDGNSYTIGTIDWGLDNAQILDLSWYFGNHPYANEQTGQFLNINGSYAVKYYSDTVISGFLWLVFGWYVFHNLPDLFAGETGQATAIARNYSTYTKKEKTKQNQTEKKDGEK